LQRVSSTLPGWTVTCWWSVTNPMAPHIWTIPVVWRCHIWSLPPDSLLNSLPWPLSLNQWDNGLTLSQSSVPFLPQRLPDSCNSSPRHKPSFSSAETLSPSPLQLRAIVSAVIYVKAFVGLLVLTVSVLSNGNNYGAFHPLFTGLLWGREAWCWGRADGEARLFF
jgi:hypothetical protein